MTIIGVSPQIDSCGGMIFKEAIRYYKRLSPVSQRWLSDEDMVQEGLNAAIEAEKSWKEGAGAKFSTHLLQGLRWHLAKVCQRLELKKRALDSVVELDAPVRIGEMEGAVLDLIPASVSLASTFADLGDEWNSVKSFIELCRAVSSRAAMAFIQGLLFSNGYRVAPALCAELALAASKLRIGINDFRALTNDENIRRIALRLTARFVMLEAGIEDEAICLECIECGVRLPFSAIRKGEFAPETMTCVACLRKLKDASHRCFGKQYDPGEAAECRLHCLDREMCRKFMGVKAVGSKTKEEAAAAVADVDLGDVEQEAAELKKTKAKKAKTVTAPAAVDESEGGYTEKALRSYLNHYGDDKYSEPPAPEKAFARRWPFKQGSILRFAFQWGFLGLTAAEMKKMLTVMDFGEAGSWDFAVKTLRTGVVGKTPPHRLVFQVDETDGGLRIYNVKKGAGYVEKPKAAPKPGPRPVDPTTGARVGSKKQLILDAVRRENGATSQELIDLTDWNDHSIRGFISGQKRVGVIIESQKWEDGTRSYVLRSKSAKPKPTEAAKPDAKKKTVKKTAKKSEK